MRAALLLAILAPAGCGVPERPGPDPFAVTGELIALSGGDAGAESACIACHGLNGEGNGAGAPRLAGLGIGYLGRQMEFYAVGLRQHAEMQRIAERLRQRDRQMVAEYYAALNSAPAPAGGVGGGSSLPPSGIRLSKEPLPAPPRNRGGERVGARLYLHGDPARGLPSCASCHGAAGEGAGAGNPPLAGQPAAYLAAQMHAWRESRRRGDPLNMMLRISQALSPDEIRSIAAYVSALPGAPSRPGYAEASLRARRGGPRNGA